MLPLYEIYFLREKGVWVIIMDPLRRWLREIWNALRWPMPAPQFGEFVVYGYARRSPGTRPAQVLQGALLAAVRWVRFSRIHSERPRTVEARRKVGTQDRVTPTCMTPGAPFQKHA